MIENILPGNRLSRVRELVTGGVILILLSSFPGPLHSLAQAETLSEDNEVVSGLLKSVDLPAKRGVITTDLGTQVPFEITKPELFINLSVGQRVTLKLDKQGRAIRVMDNAAPELPPPSAPR
ncbi:MAG: exported protein of unknown function [Nitrospira sp.]|jgi:hypothetical protein|nr:exported protein of unknown function [Nitrospira sp.]